MNNNNLRVLGKSGIKVSPMGFGCWAIGGEFFLDGKQDGWGHIDDDESVRAIRRAVELGVNFFDTADVYGAGHSEEVLGKALKDIRDRVVVSTKFGHVFDAETKHVIGTNATRKYIKKACEDSLKRLGTDYIDIYHLHIWSLSDDEAGDAFQTLEELMKEGKIKTYGWSTDSMDCIDFMINNTNAVAIQHQFNIFINADDILKICQDNNLASINRSPLAMGLLSGKFNKDSKLPGNDIRGNNHDWNMYFKDGKPAEIFLNKLNTVREILKSNGRTLVQGALAYLWAKSDKTIPIPGFKTVKQVEENAGALSFGPLTEEQVNEVDSVLNDKAAF